MSFHHLFLVLSGKKQAFGCYATFKGLNGIE
jgi:hypothetical protein